ncbi:MAG: hypothetical protein WC866_04210 [Patescibacteria group bacterium]|jgi:uncharacterized repeat protein (TIGR01451 family)
MEEKPKQPKQDLEQELKQIYSDSDGAMPDFTRLDGKPGSRLRSALILSAFALLVIGGATWAGIFLFSRTSGFSGNGVGLTVQTDGAFTSGSEEEVVIRYQNRERIPLARANIVLKMPEGFTMTIAELPSTEKNTWAIGSIAPGAEGEVKVRGYVKRELEAALTFQAELNYKPADFNAEFQKVASHTVVVKDAALTLSATGTPEMTPGDEIAYVFDYENRSELPLENIRLQLDPLEGFIFETSKPKNDEGVAMQWTFPKIEAGAKASVTVRGTFSAASRGQKTLHGRMGFAENSKMIEVAKADTTTNVLKSNLDLALIVNGSDKPPIASFGDTLYFSVRYENAGDVALKDVVISAALPSEPTGKTILDWVSLKDDLLGKRVGSTVSWTKKELPALALLGPGDKGEIAFSVQLIRKPFSDVTSSVYAIHAVASAMIGKAGKISGSRQVDTAPFNILLQSDTAFQAYGRYFNEDGTPIGSGPLPPKAGEKTIYRVTWVVQNSLHELTDLTATTLLPQGAKWTGEERTVEAGSLSFDETGRKATWRLNRMPTSVKSVSINFDVELIPEAEDAGKIVDITGDNRLEGFDKDVGTVILKTAPSIGTDLLGDESAAGKGVVRE